MNSLRIPVAPGVSLNCIKDDYLWPWQSATPVLLVHGFSRSAEVWTRWIPTIARTRRAYRLELRGCGDSDVPPDDHKVTLDQIFTDLLKVLDHIEAPKAHLVGESSSGQFLFAFAGSHPRRVASVTLCETTPQMQRRLFDLYKLDTDSPAAAIRKYGIGEWCRLTLDHRLDKANQSPEVSAWLINIMTKTPSHVAAAMIDCFFGIDNFPLLSQMKVPVLQLAGSGSAATNVDEQEMMSRTIPRAKLKVFAGIGGMLHILRADDCAREACDFWDDVERTEQG